MTVPAQQLVGWRLWRMRDGRLASWAADYVWQPGPNEARCLNDPIGVVQPGPCERSPGVGCRCGLWAVREPDRCLRMAREGAVWWDTGAVVLGLIVGWGSTAIHGEEGFRCQHAAVSCLFTDAVDDRALAAVGRRRWWGGLMRRLASDGPSAVRRASIVDLGGRYGVPALSLGDAIHLGALSEFGVPSQQVARIRTRVVSAHR